LLMRPPRPNQPWRLSFCCGDRRRVMSRKRETRMSSEALDALKARIFARVVSGLRRPLTQREEKSLATACELVFMGGATEQASLEEYAVKRALELAQR
jgi:hypothetical protein